MVTKNVPHTKAVIRTKKGHIKRGQRVTIIGEASILRANYNPRTGKLESYAVNFGKSFWSTIPAEIVESNVPG